MFARLRNQLRYLVDRRRIDRDLAEELEIHRDMLAEDQERLGYSRETAILNARRKMGNTAVMADYARDAWVVAWLDTLAGDVRYALRSFARTPGFTALALLTLALGIGANAAIFTVVNSVLLRPLPYADPEHLVTIWSVNERQGGTRPAALLEGDAVDIRDAAQSLEQFAAFQANLIPITLRSGTDTHAAQAVSVTPGLFTLLGRQALLGRTLQDGDRFALVISYGYWQRQFGGDPAAIGRQVTIGAQAATIVGVMPKAFQFPYRSMLLASVSFTRGSNVDAWVPMSLTNRRPNDTLRLIGGVARLQPGVTIEQARSEIESLGRRFAAEFPATNSGWTATVVGAHAQTVGAVRPLLLLLLGGVGVVLLMACVNVANLLLARSVRRQQEMAIRSAIGARRGRLLRQTLTESALLTLFGAALSSFVIEWIVRAFVALAPSGMPRLAEVAPDWRAALYMLAIALVTALAAGWLPAVASSRVDLQHHLTDGGRGSSASRGSSFRSALVVAEIALAVVLAVATGLFVRSFAAVVNVDPGFEVDRLLTMQIGVPRAYDTPQKRREFYARLFARLEAVPGVTTVGGTTRLPLGGFNSSTRVTVEGRDPGRGAYDVGLRRAMHEYFAAMQIPLLRGRSFTSADGPGSAAVVIINQTMAARVFGEADPIGRRVTLAENAGIGSATIVGVVGDVRHGGLESAPEPEVYIHYLQNPPTGPLIVMRTSGEPADLTAAARGAVHDVDAGVTISDVRTMSDLRSQAMTERRFVTALAVLFGVIALTLAVLGVYGVMALAVSERTREIGIRLALGAPRGTVLALVVRNGLGLAVTGIAIGIAAALAAGPTLASQLYGITPHDPVTLVGVPVLLLGAAVAASVIPARRAMTVDPTIALRSG